MFSPTGYYAHYGRRGKTPDPDRITKTLPVVSFEPAESGAMVCGQDGYLAEAWDIPNFLYVSPKSGTGE
jgi:hypothetical protein